MLLSDRDNGLFIVDVSAVVPEPGAMTITWILLIVGSIGRRGWGMDRVW